MAAEGAAGAGAEMAGGLRLLLRHPNRGLLRFFLDHLIPSSYTLIEKKKKKNAVQLKIKKIDGWQYSDLVFRKSRCLIYCEYNQK